MGNEKLTTLARRLRPFLTAQVAALISGGAVTEGPDIDLVTISGGVQVGRGGDTILLFDSAGSPVAEYAATGAGLTAALAAATSGDIVFLPAANITGGPWTVASGVFLTGMGEDSQITGTVTNNGILGFIRINGNITNNNTMRFTRVDVSSGDGVTQSLSAGVIDSCYITHHSGAANYGVSLTGGNMQRSLILHTGGASSGVLINGADASAFHCHITGAAHGAVVKTTNLVFNCTFVCSYETPDGSGCIHDAGTARMSNCSFHGNVNAIGIELTAGNITLTDCTWEAITGANYITYGTGDRGAYSVEDYHATDIEAAALTRHNPLPGAAGGIPYSDGTNWTRVALTSYLGVRSDTTITAGTTTLDATNDIVYCNAVGGAITVNLPAAASSDGRAYTIKKIDSSAYTVTIDGNASELIDGVQTQVISYQWTSVTIHCDGTGWYII